MPSTKPKVVSYLDDDEKAAFDELCSEHGYSDSKGVAHLIRKQLIELDDAKDAIACRGNYESRIASLEESRNVDIVGRRSVADDIVTLNIEVFDLKEEVIALKQQINEREKGVVTDEQIAAVTAQPVEKVTLWRKGLWKPRGSRILDKLKPYSVVDGRWVKQHG